MLRSSGIIIIKNWLYRNYTLVSIELTFAKLKVHKTGFILDRKLKVCNSHFFAIFYFGLENTSTVIKINSKFNLIYIYPKKSVTGLRGGGGVNHENICESCRDK